MIMVFVIVYDVIIYVFFLGDVFKLFVIFGIDIFVIFKFRMVIKFVIVNSMVVDYIVVGGNIFEVSWFDVVVFVVKFEEDLFMFIFLDVWLFLLIG